MLPRFYLPTKDMDFKITHWDLPMGSVVKTSSTGGMDLILVEELSSYMPQSSQKRQKSPINKNLSTKQQNKIKKDSWPSPIHTHRVVLIFLFSQQTCETSFLTSWYQSPGWTLDLLAHSLMITFSELSWSIHHGPAPCASSVNLSRVFLGPVRRRDTVPLM